MGTSHEIPRRDFLARSAGAVGAMAVAGTLSEKLLAASANEDKDGVATQVYVRIAGKTHFITVHAWLSEAVHGVTKSTSVAEKQAVVSRLIHENEKFLDIVTHGGSHVGNFRLYVDVPPPKLEGEMVHAADTEKLDAGCYRNVICCEWAANGKWCCVHWACCDLG